ncbi:MAG: hypothetical protein M1483_06425 [Actinobacteria bacterium]|nr:hypothetical protein [Actinomycetota bacterium]MCL6105241.1 hypothetical protein [Actinomycetota bacterium]
MKNITFSAKADAIDQAREVAKQKHTTLNEMFRQWLEEINERQSPDGDVADRLGALWKRINYLCVGKKLSRDEMNER